MEALTLSPLKETFDRIKIQLPASKSESNRALILQALSGGRIELDNLSDARDTQTMLRLLASNEEELNVGDAGTTMRFLTAFHAFGYRDVILTGTDRMQKRPIGPLVDALRHLGAEIRYMKQEGYPPLFVFGRNAHFGSRSVRMAGNISSQFISALLMIGASLPDGLEIEIEEPIFSRPYIEMTLSLMKRFGIESAWNGNRIEVKRQPIRSGSYSVEGDWSAASYWYSVLALKKSGSLLLQGLREDSLQGDQAIAQLMLPLGIQTEYLPEGALLTYTGETDALPEVIDFLKCPDLAQTVLPCLAALNISARFSGLESLRIKETDRIDALQRELGNFGTRLIEVKTGLWELSGSFQPQPVNIHTYEDHRMAMGFAPLAAVIEGLSIEEPGVVAKSFPRFWEEWTKISQS